MHCMGKVLPVKFVSRLFGCCWVKFQRHIETLSREKVLFIDHCFTLHQSDLLGHFKLNQTYSFEQTCSQASKQYIPEGASV